MEQQARLEGLRLSQRSRLEILPLFHSLPSCWELREPAAGQFALWFAAALLTVLGLGLAAYWFINRGKGLTGVELKEAEKPCQA